MKRIQVLISTYNGEKYIQEQLDSILAQKEVEIHCLIRDDGSTDNTAAILSEYLKQTGNIEIIFEKNIGYAASFLELVKRSGNYDFYAFADQDDVWEPMKLKKAIDKIAEGEINTPILYCSNCTIVDEYLNKTGMLHSKENVIPQNKITALVQGFAQGCTIVFNCKSKELVLKYEPKQQYAHDFWIPLLHVFLGKIIYDKNSYMLYRQHGNNVFGGSRSLLRLIKIKLGFLTKESNYYSRMAEELLLGYGGELDEDEQHQLKEIAEYRSSLYKYIRLFFNKALKRNTVRGTLIIRSLILFTRF